MKTADSSSFDRHDVLTGLGVLLLAVGAGLAWLPAGLMLGGLGLVGVGILGGRDAVGHKEARHGTD